MYRMKLFSNLETKMLKNQNHLRVNPKIKKKKIDSFQIENRLTEIYQPVLTPCLKPIT